MTADIGEQIARDLYRRFGHEIPAAFDLTDGHCKTFMRTGLVTGGTTSLEDCMLLYLLVRGYGCKHVFEIGTYIGTSTVAMNEAVRRNGGICTTSDPVNYRALPPYSGIRFINERASIALQILQQEARGIDFCFMDWIPEDAALEIAKTLFTGDTIIAVHDYLPNDKGEIIVNRIKETYGRERTGTWFEPKGAPWRMDDGRLINNCTAFFLPPSLTTRLQP
jgi:hypothetical protein